MNKPLNSKVALVTGGARGVGKEVIRRLANDGANIAFVYGQSSDAADAVIAEISALGVKVKSYQADLSEPATLPALVPQVMADFGAIDILVNCAGVFTVGVIEDVEMEEYERVMKINVDAVFYLTSAVAKVMKSGSRIICFSSTLADRAGGPALGVYNASKAAVSALAKAWAADLGPKGILVNSIQPGHINTDMNPNTTDYAAEMKTRIPLARYAEPVELAGVVAFLAGPDASYITGTTLDVDGGLNA